MACRVRPRILRAGPREFVVTVYGVDDQDGAREVAFRAAVERARGRARLLAFQLMNEVTNDLHALGFEVHVEALIDGDLGRTPEVARAEPHGAAFAISSSIERHADGGFVVTVVAEPRPDDVSAEVITRSGWCRSMKEARREQARLVIATAKTIRAEGGTVAGVELV